MWTKDIDTVDYIRIPDLQHRRLYRIYARNLRLGVYNAPNVEFWGLRTKFGRTFAESEFHWDHEHHATTKPYELLDEPVPADLELKYSLGSVCEHCGSPSEYRAFEGGPRPLLLKTGITIQARGGGVHLVKTDCTTCDLVMKGNPPLDAWLREMYAKYPGDRPDQLEPLRKGSP